MVEEETPTAKFAIRVLWNVFDPVVVLEHGFRHQGQAVLFFLSIEEMLIGRGWRLRF
jgi:hypothetical protein